MSECILWHGAKDESGYGQVKIAGKMRRAHRIALEIKLGRKLKHGEISMHNCHTPSCINKDHLEVGDVATNNKQARKRKITLADQYLNGWNKIYK